MPGMAIRNWFVRLMRVAGGHARRFYSAATLAAVPAALPASPATAPWSGSAATCAPTTTPRCTTRCARRARSGAPSSSTATSSTRLPRADRRVEFIRDSLVGVDAELRALAASHGVGAGLIVRHGRAADEIPRAGRRSCGVQAVYANHDDEPAALARDAAVRGRARRRRRGAAHLQGPRGLRARRGADRQRARPRVFTPYRNAWLKKLDAVLPAGLPGRPPRRRAGAAARRATGGVPSLDAIGFEPHQPARAAPAHRRRAARRSCSTTSCERIDRYHETRDFPAVKGPSYLSAHLRFGTVSIRQLAREAHGTAREAGRGAPRSGCPS